MTEPVETPRAVTEEAPTQEITKEIALDVPQNKEDANEQSPTPQPKKATVGRKAISRLTEDERALIIKNHNEGIYQPYFDVKTLDDGTLKIVKKKPKQPTVSQKATKGQSPRPQVTQVANTSEAKPSEGDSNNKVYYSDNQLLFEHIIELNSKVDKLMNKHKKLKKRYKALQQDIYVDSVDDDSQGETLEPSHEAIPQQKPKQVFLQPQQVIQRGWRSRLSYL